MATQRDLTNLLATNQIEDFLAAAENNANGFGDYSGTVGGLTFPQLFKLFSDRQSPKPNSYGEQGSLSPEDEKFQELYPRLLNISLYGNNNAWDILHNDSLTKDTHQAAIDNAVRQDKFSFFGDNLFPALAILGAAAGGAGLYGAYGASAGTAGSGIGSLEGISAPLPVSIGEGTLATGTEALAGTSAGTASVVPSSTSILGQTIGNTGITYGQALQGISLGNSTVNVASNPSGGNLGGLIGSLASFSGIPGAGVVGGLAGSTIGGQLDSPSNVSSSVNTGDNNVPEDSVNYAPYLAGLGLLGGGVAAGLTNGGNALNPFGPQESANTNVTRDAVSTALNQYRLNQLLGLESGTGRLGSALTQYQPSYELSPQTNAFNEGIQGYSTLPGLDPAQWFQQALAAINPEAALRAGSNYLGAVARPQLENQNTALGLGRSGAQQESLAKAGAGIALPITQQALNNVNSLYQAYPQVDINARNATLGRLTAGREASDYSGALGRQKYGLQLGALTNLANGTPYNPGQQTQQSGYGNFLTDFAVPTAAQLGLSSLLRNTGNSDTSNAANTIQGFRNQGYGNVGNGVSSGSSTFDLSPSSYDLSSYGDIFGSGSAYL